MFVNSFLLKIKQIGSIICVFISFFEINVKTQNCGKEYGANVCGLVLFLGH